VSDGSQNRPSRDRPSDNASLVSGWSNHPTVSVRHPELGAIEIDEEIAPLIEALWALEIETSGSCQDRGGQVWLSFLTPDDAAKFVRELAIPPDPNPDSLYERQGGVIENGWEWLAWFEPQMAADPEFSLIIELMFPRADLPQVMDRFGIGS